MDDIARFDRQRRNVMATSALLLGAYITHARFTGIPSLGLTVDYTHRIEGLWILLIFYFLVRFHQMCDQTIEEEISDLKSASFGKCIHKVAAEMAKAEAIDSLRNTMEREGWAVQNIRATTAGAIRMFEAGEEDSNTWRIKVNVNIDYEREGGNSHTASAPIVVIHVSDENFSKASALCKRELWLDRKLFTEYKLPYILAITAVAIGLLHLVFFA